MYKRHIQKCFLNLHKFRANVKAPSNRGSHRTLPVLIHNDSILWQLLLDQYDFLLTFYDKISACKVKSRNYDCDDKLIQSVLTLFSFCIPGSSGHSLSFANSMGVFPVSTQLELRNIIGILQKQNTINILIRNKHWIKWQDYFKNHAKPRPKHIFYLPIGSALRMILWLPRVYSMSTVMGAE